MTGYGMAYMNPLSKTVIAAYDIEQSSISVTIGYLSALVPLGAGIGSIYSYWLVNRVKRRHYLIASDLIGIVGTLLAISGSLRSLSMGRFIQGLAIGMNSTIIPTYIREYSPESLRGKTGVLQSLLKNVGLLTAFIFGLMFMSPQPQLLKYPILLPILPMLIRSILLIFHFKLEPPNAANIHKYIDFYTNKHIKEIVTVNKANPKDNNSLRGIGHAMLLSFLNQMLGINAVIFYSTTIFQQLTKDAVHVAMFNMLMPIIGVLCAYSAGVLLGYISQLRMLKIGIIGCVVSLMWLGYETSKSESNNTVLFIFTYLISFQSSFGPVLPVEIAGRVTPKGRCIVSVMSFVASSFIGQLFPIMVAYYSISICFYIFSISGVIGFCYLQFVLNEPNKKLD